MRIVPWKNCLALGSDNAPVMSGKQKGVFGFLQKKQPDLYFAGCPCHLFGVKVKIKTINKVHIHFYLNQRF